MADLTTATAVESYLGMAPNEGDTTLDTIVSAVSQSMQRWMGRQIVEATYAAEKHSGDGHHAFVVPLHAPVTTLTSIVLSGTTLDSTDYELEASEGRWPVIYYTPGDATTPSPWPRGSRNIALTYDAGYAAVPASLAQAAIEQSAYVWRGKERIGQRTKSIGGDVTESYLIDAFLPQVLAVMELYRSPRAS